MDQTRSGIYISATTHNPLTLGISIPVYGQTPVNGWASNFSPMPIRDRHIQDEKPSGGRPNNRFIISGVRKGESRRIKHSNRRSTRCGRTAIAECQCLSVRGKRLGDTSLGAVPRGS